MYGGGDCEHNDDSINFGLIDYGGFLQMKSLWQTETGRLECRWAEVGQRAQYNPQWMKEASEIRGSYLPPVTDFASHSPFGGPSWFEGYTHQRDWNKTAS